MNIRIYSLFCLIFLNYFQIGAADWCKRVYLATYPRSGNHWCRCLVEEASHIATGAVYCDREPQHLPDPFPWGGYCADHGYKGNCRYPQRDEFVLIKTHWPGQKKEASQFDNRCCKLIIRIVRNPIDAFYSQYVKRSKGSPKDEIVPSAMVKECVMLWKKFQSYWNKQKHVVTIRYEDMLENPHEKLNKILKLLQYSYTPEDIDRAVAAYPPEGGVFKHIAHFRKSDLELIYNELEDLLEQFNYASSLKEIIQEISS